MREFEDEKMDIGEGFDQETSVSLTRDKWVKAQRDLVTTTLDYNLQAIAKLVADGAIDLSPSFQRRERWDRVRQSQLIESFLMNVPLPPIFLNEDDYGVYSIIDGKQRLTAISDFMADRYELRGLEVFQEAEGLRFSELDRGLRMVLETRASLRAIIILRMSDPDIKYQVFQRLNTGGVRLNAQELRNVAIAGPFNSALVEWAAEERFARLLGVAEQSEREKSALWKQMRDVELVLRFFTLRDGWEEFSGSLVGEMNAFAASNKDVEGPALDALKRAFDDAATKVSVVFGVDSFRRFNPERQTYGTQVLASVYDAQMLSLSEFDLEQVKSRSAEIRLGMESLFRDPDFLQAIGAQTNTPRSVRQRIASTREMVANAIAG